MNDYRLTSSQFCSLPSKGKTFRIGWDSRIFVILKITHTFKFVSGNVSKNTSEFQEKLGRSLDPVFLNNCPHNSSTTVLGFSVKQGNTKKLGQNLPFANRLCDFCQLLCKQNLISDA